MKVTPFTRDLLKAYREEKAKVAKAEKGLDAHREFVATLNGKPTEANEENAQGHRQG